MSELSLAGPEGAVAAAQPSPLLSRGIQGIRASSGSFLSLPGPATQGSRAALCTELVLSGLLVCLWRSKFLADGEADSEGTRAWGLLAFVLSRNWGYWVTAVPQYRVNFQGWL